MVRSDVFTLDMPGALWACLDWLADDELVGPAFGAAVPIRAGRGWTYRITATGDVMLAITHRVDAIVGVGRDGDYSAAEITAARRWIKRYEEAGI